VCGCSVSVVVYDVLQCYEEVVGSPASAKYVSFLQIDGLVLGAKLL